MTMKHLLLPETIGIRELLLMAQWEAHEIDAASLSTNRKRAQRLRDDHGITPKKCPRRGWRYDPKEVAEKLAIRNAK